MKKLFKAIAMRRKRKFRKDFLLALIAADHGRYGYHYLSLIAVVLTEFADGRSIEEVKDLCDTIHDGTFTGQTARLAAMQAKQEASNDFKRKEAVQKLAGIENGFLDYVPGRANDYPPSRYSSKKKS